MMRTMDEIISDLGLVTPDYSDRPKDRSDMEMVISYLTTIQIRLQSDNHALNDVVEVMLEQAKGCYETFLKEGR